MTGRRLAVTVALAAALSVSAASPAAATFPGRNGEIALGHLIGGRYSDPQFSLLRFAARLGEPVEHMVCARGPSVHPYACRWVGALAISPDGATLALVADEQASGSLPRWALWLLSPYGERTASVPLRAGYEVLSWSPDGSDLLAAGPDGVVVLALDGTERRLVAADATGGDWCADGRMVVERYGELHVVDASGLMRRLTWRGGTEPSCAPGARRVAFTRQRAIWTLPLSAGRRARRLTRGRAPAWSPDGKQIAYLREDRRGLEDFTYLRRVGLRRLRTRQVSRNEVMANDGYSGIWVEGPEWRPLSRSAVSPSG